MASLHSLVRGLPDALMRQYNYEITHVAGGSQLMHSPFFQVHSRAYNNEHLFDLLCVCVVCGWISL